ncbi:MAG: hypothetical protein OJF50_005254 [Nitrospira sp.]|jgi:hypothetical protein|nr:hypothetical protein [Nitrospira sp.]
MTLNIKQGSCLLIFEMTSCIVIQGEESFFDIAQRQKLRTGKPNSGTEVLEDLIIIEL